MKAVTCNGYCHTSCSCYFKALASVEPLSCTLYNHVSNMPPQIYEDGTAFGSWRRQECQFMCGYILDL